MAEDRLRELIDLVLGSLDVPGADGPALARQAHFSRDHLDRLLAAATGESPVALRRRLLLERAAWQLRVARLSPSEVAPVAGYGSLAAFSRAFARAYGVSPRGFAAAAAPPVALPAPNGIRFHPPAGLLIPRGTPAPAGAGVPLASAGRGSRGGDPTERLLVHHLARTRELLTAAAGLAPERLRERRRPGLVVVGLEGEEADAATMARRLVTAIEVWVAAMAGLPAPPSAYGDDEDHDPAALLRRLDRAGPACAKLVRALGARGAWEDAFVDALCEPPQMFTYGGVVAHLLSAGTIRREALAGVLAELGAAGLASGDPLEWELDQN
ncbi:helix-turn-helix domain-containing protein [Conexibacter sp. JD483]|uniref:helix-turn-helix domain-containing protein n=1 Tax=unclassified Conexibacter TaxID=2627773 RepID=UPI00271C7969|nr:MULTISPECIES: helix-turn-helix domain-containing protein [unclassified Conexibacter]MDO8187104.1 helix-turn-helix domain-containing protein [Conexibacter sp. CPCC 205706]MDO8200962.1 helix-turn-helix domain-containing protein [Conexibacter sp. CPCC 205762]MDR9371885.1 helix-turn-helix domain-containing protein [Conexibacter sp. JD483]